MESSEQLVNRVPHTFYFEFFWNGPTETASNSLKTDITLVSSTRTGENY